MISRLIFLLLAFACADTHATDVEGHWVPPAGDAVIRIDAKSDSLTVTLVRVSDPSLLDSENPDSRLRARPLAGVILGQGFTLRDSAWVGGQLYDPGSGNTYKSRIVPIDDNYIELRGYVGTPLFGRSEVWTRLALFRSQMNTMLDQECLR